MNAKNNANNNNNHGWNLPPGGEHRRLGHVPMNAPVHPQARLPPVNFALPQGRIPQQQQARVPPPNGPVQGPPANNDGGDSDDEDESHPLRIKIIAPMLVRGNNNICSVDTAAITTSVSVSIANAILRMTGGEDGGGGIPMIDGNGNPRKIEVVVDVGTRIDGEGNLVGDKGVIASIHGDRGLPQHEEGVYNNHDHEEDHERFLEEAARLAAQRELGEQEQIAREAADNNAKQNQQYAAQLAADIQQRDVADVIEGRETTEKKEAKTGRGEGSTEEHPRRKPTARRRKPIVKFEPVEESAFINNAPAAHPAVNPEVLPHVLPPRSSAREQASNADESSSIFHSNDHSNSADEEEEEPLVAKIPSKGKTPILPPVQTSLNKTDDRTPCTIWSSPHMPNDSQIVNEKEAALGTPMTMGGTPKVGSKDTPTIEAKRKSVRITRDDDVASNAGLGIPRDMQEIAVKKPRRG